MSISGILNIDKPAGWTSFDVVAFVRSRAHVKRVGHAGTLDPFAEGVLPVCLGQATRVIEYLMDARKAYRALVRLGRETDTYDRTGSTVAETDAGAVSAAQVEETLYQFRGQIEQRPPAFSALKRDGVPLYRLARAGERVEAPARQAVIYSIRLTSFEPPFAGIELECSKGTYVRSLAHDLGRSLGVGGSLEALTRLRVGPFELTRAVDIETLRGEFESGEWRARLMAPDEVLLEWPAAILGAENERRVRTGVAPQLEHARPRDTAHARAYSISGEFLAVMRSEATGRWRPEKVFEAS